MQTREAAKAEREMIEIDRERERAKDGASLINNLPSAKSREKFKRHSDKT